MLEPAFKKACIAVAEDVLKVRSLPKLRFKEQTCDLCGSLIRGGQSKLDRHKQNSCPNQPGLSVIEIKRRRKRSKSRDVSSSGDVEISTEAEKPGPGPHGDCPTGGLRSSRLSLGRHLAPTEHNRQLLAKVHYFSALN